MNYGNQERKETLRAGIAALIRDNDIKKQQVQNTAWEIPTQSTQLQRPVPGKSVILPGKLQEKRARAQQAAHQKMADCHFADPTISFALKAVSPQRNPVIHERSFSAPPTPL